VRALRRLYDFITGGSIAAPIGLCCAIVATIVLPAWRAPVFVALVAAAFVASVFETPR